MGFADNLRRHSTKPVGPCVIGQLADLMEPADRTALHAALADPTITSTAITRALNDEGFAIARTTLLRHRTGDCCCARLPT